MSNCFSLCFRLARNDLEAKDSLAKVSLRMKKYANKGWQSLEFNVGDQVWLKMTLQIWKNLHQMDVPIGIVSCYDGSFEIVEKVGNVAYYLNLPG